MAGPTSSNVGHSQPFPVGVCAIGASAGGLDPLETFFASMPVHTGLAFVVIQHLSPDHESMMDSLLQRHTTMLVRQASDGDVLRPDHVYLIPPDRVLTVEGNTLRLSERDRSTDSPPSPHPIDTFFESLAQQWGQNAAAIVLSGTGDDGAAGSEQVRRAGGLTLAQDSSASFEGMPTAADRRGFIDAVASVPAISTFVVDFFEHGKRPASSSVDTRYTALEESIIADLAASTGINFQDYKRGTVRRRIEHRMTITGDQALTDLADRVRSSLDERAALTNDILIGVTSFFRDPEVYEAVQRDVIPRLLTEAAAQGRSLRTWVVGCATGQEAYSLAMVLLEERQRLGLDVQLQIFATDVHEEALTTATDGVYAEAALEGVSEERRMRFFRPHAEGLRVRDEVRAIVTFARHNMLSDTPFSRIDLVTCRNTLIYFNPTAQQRALWALGFALRHQGTLVLGNSETPGFLVPDFEPVSTTHRIFTKTGDSATKSFRRRMGADFSSTVGSGLAVARPSTGTDQALLRAYDLILDEAFVGGLIIDRRNEILHVMGSARTWLEHASGRPSLDVHSVIRDQNLRIAIGAVLRDLGEPDANAAERIVTVHLDGTDDQQLFIQGQKIQTGTGFYSFISGRPLEQPLEIPADFVVGLEPRDLDRIGQLESELAYTRESLQAALEEQETSNEELNAANEELIASNEELQSSNEELSALNEELRTLNDEHHRRLQEVLELTADLEQILTSTQIGILLLNHDGTIRRFSDPARDYFHLLATDQGRPFDHIRARFHSEEFAIATHEALTMKKATSLRVQLENSDTALVRVGPYSLPHEETGVAISALALGSAATSGREALLVDYFATNPYKIAIFDADRRCVLDANSDGLTHKSLDDCAQELGTDVAELITVFDAATISQTGTASVVLNAKSERLLVQVWNFESSGRNWYGVISAETDGLQSGLGSWVESQTVGVIAELLGVGAAVVQNDGTVGERFSAGAGTTDSPALDHPENLLALSDIVASAAELGFHRIDQRVDMFVNGESKDVAVRGLRLGSAEENPFLVIAFDT